MNKYRALGEHLEALAAAGRHTSEMAFSEVASVVGGLPRSAYDYREWWANGTSSHQRAWREAGWAVDHVALDRQRVRFTWTPTAGDRARSSRISGDARVPKTLPVELESSGADVRVRFHWRRAGDITESNGTLRFPPLPRSPGVYRLMFARRDDRSRVYVGESDDLTRRARNYRNPGPTQRTSQRIHDELLGHLRDGGTVSMSVALDAEIEVDGRSAPLPLGRKTARVLVEHTALGLAYLDGAAVVVNKDQGIE